MTIIYRLPERPFLRQNLMALGALFLFITVFVLMIVASSVPSALMNAIPNGGGRFGVFIAGVLVSLAIAFSLFEMIYWITPNKKMTFKTTWCGALIGAVTLEIFIILFPLYVRQFMSNYAGQFSYLELNSNLIASVRILHLCRSNWLCCHRDSLLLLLCSDSHTWCSNQCSLL